MDQFATLHRPTNECGSPCPTLLNRPILLLARLRRYGWLASKSAWRIGVRTKLRIFGGLCSFETGRRHDASQTVETTRF